MTHSKSANALSQKFGPVYNMHRKTEFLQRESQLQQDELHKRSHHYETIFVQNIETDSHKQKFDNVEVHSDSMPNEGEKLHVEAEIQSVLPKSIIRPWEELVHNKYRTSLGYDKDVSFHILDYSKPIKFQSAGFLHDSSPSAVPDYAPLP